MSDDKRIGELEHELAAVRELMNCYNLGGWTDANAAMKRALAAEAALAERTKERDAAIRSAEAAEKDAARLDWIEKAFFERHWSGTLGEPSYWTMVGPFRHTLQRMRGKNLRDAIDAARAEGER